MATESPTQRVVEELRVELFRRGLSQTGISDQVGMSPSAISRRLNGDVSPTLDELSALAAAAGQALEISLVPIEQPVAAAV